MRYPPHTYDDFRPGAAFVAEPREISRADIDAFSALSGDRTALHTDDEYAATTAFGGVVAHGCLNLAAATGQAYALGAFEGTVLAFRDLQVSFDRPVRPGDAVTLTLTVQELDPRPREDRGTVAFLARLDNQHGKRVLSGTWRIVLRRGTT